MKKYNKGDIINVKISAVEPYGAFVKIDDEYTGLIHISEINGLFIHNINDYFKIDDVLNAKIIDIDEENKHIKLSLKGIKIPTIFGKDKLKETELGFELLEDLLPEWIEEKVKEIKKTK